MFGNEVDGILRQLWGAVVAHHWWGAVVGCVGVVAVMGCVGVVAVMGCSDGATLYRYDTVGLLYKENGSMY